MPEREVAAFLQVALGSPEGFAFPGGPAIDRLLVYTYQGFPPAHQSVQRTSALFSFTDSSHKLSCYLFLGRFWLDALGHWLGMVLV